MKTFCNLPKVMNIEKDTFQDTKNLTVDKDYFFRCRSPGLSIDLLEKDIVPKKRRLK